MEPVKDIEAPASADAPKKRTLEEVRNHYKELCNAAGQLQYQIKVQEMELNAVVQVMSDVNREAAALVEEASNGQSQVN